VISTSPALNIVHSTATCNYVRLTASDYEIVQDRQIKLAIITIIIIITSQQPAAVAADNSENLCTRGRIY